SFLRHYKASSGFNITTNYITS
ncbi:hypothetical protein ACN38_g435, partial [Penicillium nordicum]